MQHMKAAANAAGNADVLATYAPASSSRRRVWHAEGASRRPVAVHNAWHSFTAPPGPQPWHPKQPTKQNTHRTKVVAAPAEPVAAPSPLLVLRPGALVVAGLAGSEEWQEEDEAMTLWPPTEGGAQPAPVVPSVARGLATHDSMHPAVVMKRIKRSKSVWGLQRAYTHCQHAFTPIHYTAALLQLAKVQHEPGWSHTSLQHPSHIATVPYDASNAAPARPAHHSEQQDSSAGGENQGQGVADAGHAGTGAAAQNEPAHAPLLRRLLEGVRGVLGEVDGCGIANTVEALAELGHHDPDFMQVCEMTWHGSHSPCTQHA